MGVVSAEVTCLGLAQRLLSSPEKFPGLNHRFASAGSSKLLLWLHFDHLLEAVWLRFDGRPDSKRALCLKERKEGLRPRAVSLPLPGLLGFNGTVCSTWAGVFYRPRAPPYAQHFNQITVRANE